MGPERRGERWTGLQAAGGEPHSALCCRETRCSMHGVLRPNHVAAAAPLRVWHALRRATSHGVTRFSGRRGCGYAKLVALNLWSGTRHIPVG